MKSFFIFFSLLSFGAKESNKEKHRVGNCDFREQHYSKFNWSPRSRVLEILSYRENRGVAYLV